MKVGELDMKFFTDSFIRDVVMPEIARTGGATVSTSNGDVYPWLDTPENVDREYVLCGFPGTSTEYVDPHSHHGSVDYLLGFAANSIMDHNAQHTYSGVGFWLHDGVIHVDYVETYTLHTMAVQRARECGIDTLHRIHGMPSGQCCEHVPALVAA
jgi:hypothetical protein